MEFWRSRVQIPAPRFTFQAIRAASRLCGRGPTVAQTWGGATYERTHPDHARGARQLREGVGGKRTASVSLLLLVLAERVTRQEPEGELQLRGGRDEGNPRCSPRFRRRRVSSTARRLARRSERA